MSGGSASLVAKRNTQHTDKMDNAKLRAIEKLGLQAFNDLQDRWNSLKTGYDEPEWELGQGMIVTLLETNFSQIEIKAILGAGGHRINALL